MWINPAAIGIDVALAEINLVEGEDRTLKRRTESTSFYYLSSLVVFRKRKSATEDLSPTMVDPMP